MLDPEPALHVIDDDDVVIREVGSLMSAHHIPVKTYHDGRDFLDAGPAAGCILSEAGMAGMNGTTLLREMRGRGSLLPFLVLTGHANVAMAVEAMKAGAMDFIEKPFADACLLAVVRQGMQLHEILRFRWARVVEARERLAALSIREREVLVAVSEGKASKAIAHDLGLSVRTVDVHRGRLMAKLKVENAASAVALLRKAEGDIGAEGTAPPNPMAHATE